MSEMNIHRYIILFLSPLFLFYLTLTHASLHFTVTPFLTLLDYLTNVVCTDEESNST